MQLWIYHSEHPDGALSFVLLFTDYDGINYGGVFIGQKDQNNRKECYWTLCIVTFAKHEPNKRFQTSKGVFERRTSTGITCDPAFLLPFLYGRRKGKFSSSFPFADLRPFPEKRTAHRRLQPEVSPVPFQYALTISVRRLQTLRRFAWKFGKTTAQKTKRPLPADVLRSKSAQLTRVPILARAVGEGPN